MRPSLRQLEYAVAVADARHFGRAAKSCHVSQPALSAQIAQLEDLLGVRLFERSRRHVLVTREGERVVAHARSVLRETDELVRVAREGGEPLSGPLRMGVIPTIAPYWLPYWLPRVRKAYPGLELYLLEDKTERLLEELDAGRLDLLLLALPVPGPELACEDLFSEPFVLAAPEGHALLRPRKRLTQEDLADQPVMLLSDGHCLRDQALALCQNAGANEARELQATSLPTLVQMVANGLGVTLLPAASVAVELRGDSGIGIRAFREPEPSRRIGLVWRATSSRESAFSELAALLRRHRPRLSVRAKAS